MTMIRKQIYIAQAHETKLKRLALATGRSEADIIREALENLPEQTDPVLMALIEHGLVLHQEVKVTRAASQKVHEDYVAMIGTRNLGLTQTILQQRQER